MKAYGSMGPDGGAGSQDIHYSDPRYMPQDVSYDDKRFKNYYGYPIQSLQTLTPAHGGLMGIPNPNQPLMGSGMPGSIPSGMTAGISSVNGMNAMNTMNGMQMGPSAMGPSLGPGIGPGSGSTETANGVNGNNSGTVSSGMSLGSGLGGMPMLMNGNLHSLSLPNMQQGIMSSLPGSMSSNMHSHDGDHSLSTANTSLNGGMLPTLHQQNVFPGKLEESGGLVSPIPPLHVQQQLVTKEDESRKTETENQIQSKCSRCKKEFTQSLLVSKDLFLGKFGAEPKLFKLCDHCRDLQRERLRRWQKKTKDKQGACRRCGNDIPPDQQKYVLCPLCRQNLRIRKANRAAQGKCVHCSGPINLLIINEETDENGRRSSVTNGAYKVCQRCRENDKIRRTNLERMGNCNRCAKALSTEEQGRHKVCLNCRQKKKKIGNVSLYSGFPGVPSMVAMENQQQGANLIPPQKNGLSHMNYMAVDQSSMMAPGAQMMSHMPQQDYVPSYAQVIPLPEVYKAAQVAQVTPMSQFSQQSQLEHGQQNQYLVQRPQFNR